MARSTLVVSAAACSLLAAGIGAAVEVGSACPKVATVRELDAGAAAGSGSAWEAADGPAAAVWRADCDVEVVAVAEGEAAALDLSGRGVQAVESVPDVAILCVSELGGEGRGRGFDRVDGQEPLQQQHRELGGIFSAVTVANLASEA